MLSARTQLVAMSPQGFDVDYGCVNRTPDSCEFDYDVRLPNGCTVVIAVEQTGSTRGAKLMLPDLDPIQETLPAT